MRPLIVLLMLCSACAASRHAGRARDTGPQEQPCAIRQADGLTVQRVDEPMAAPTRFATSPEAQASLHPAIVPSVPNGSPARVLMPIHEPMLVAETIVPQEENLMPRKKWNRLAVPAFVAAAGTAYLGLTSTSAFAVIAAIVITLALAGISLKRIRTHEQAGKGFAFAALMIGVIAALLTAISIGYYGVE